ncbi:hypothetical protein A10D4_09714 [Idiomarina xiamenensis 10-D-4]|uniref:Smp protein n=2 Tax=Idiomarina xiamenensis TaxID=1207041 RepID=K2K8G0_9GAMM|nr:hypothetical protein A10D4_09714 [Idiomarina xiamenensis 10-D-4]
MSAMYKVSPNILAIGRLLSKRLLRLAIAALLVFSIMQVWSGAVLQSQQRLLLHSQQLLRLTVEQTAHEATRYLRNNDAQSLTQLADDTIQRPGVMSVVIRDRNGEQLALAGYPTSLLDWPAHQQQQPLTLLGELGTRDQVEGYVQIIFDQQQIVHQSDSALQDLISQGRILLLLAVLAGVFIMLGFNRVRDRYWPVAENDKKS